MAAKSAGACGAATAAPPFQATSAETSVAATGEPRPVTKSQPAVAA